MIKMFVSDLDGTLLTDEKKIDPADREALLFLAKKGIQICIASGRIDRDIKWVIEELGHQCHRVSQNGGFVITREEQLLHACDFDPEMARKLCETGNEFDAISLVSVGDEVYLTKKTAYKEIEEAHKEQIKEEPNLINMFSDQLKPTKLTYIGEMDILKQLQQKVHELYPEQFDSFVSFSDCLDLMPLHVSKGDGVGRLMKNLDVSPEEVACIGDSYNDLPMFEAVTHSFAMEHADEAIKEKAAHTVKSVREAAEWVAQQNGWQLTPAPTSK
ncbi:HAD family hydrolase [Brevibacillus laterosporus]|uniref:HAD family hydrolase n=1 Tax=Brevibacillus laterosporus TaxID=1465 RepID=UPI0018CFAD64|nr:HAD family hydrolase [Brevibacillus laterosporus]MBG9790100.1 haloacid dehalogenase [Brevibacillus laterosporus]